MTKTASKLWTFFIAFRFEGDIDADEEDEYANPSNKVTIYTYMIEAL